MKRTIIAKSKANFIEGLKSPAFLNAFFNKVNWAWIWLVIRIYLGVEWLKEGLEKLFNPNWIGKNSGAEVVEFVTDAIQKTNGEHANVLNWYARFLENIVMPNAVLWGILVVFGEILVGIALVTGFFTAIAAFFGGFMNMNYLLSGSVSINPIMLLLAILLVIAWRTAGWWGLDRWILPKIGTSWQPGQISKTKEATLKVQD